MHFFGNSGLRLAMALVAVAWTLAAGAVGFNDKVLNRPTADDRLWHFGFSVGVHSQDISFTHNGFVTPEGEQWFMEQPSFSPGFCVNGLVDFRLSRLFNLRLSPGLYFGNRDITMREWETGAEKRQNLKSAQVVVPIDVKFSGFRLHNAKPYVTAGVMPTFNLTDKKGDYLRTKPFDFYLTTGFGCDFYLPYFKLVPEVKFCFGMVDVIDHKRPDLEDDPEHMNITRSLKKALSQMVVLTFYFE